MSEAFQTFDQRFQAWAENQPSHLAFKVPDPTGSGSHETWVDISIGEFDRQVDGMASVYDGVLKQKGIGKGAIVSLLLSGETYNHVVHMMGLSRAGYVPHIFPSSLSASLSSVVPNVGSWIVFYDPGDTTVQETLTNAKKRWPVPVLEMPQERENASGFKTPRRGPEDLAFVLHDPSPGPEARPVEYTYQQILTAIRKLVLFDQTLSHSRPSAKDYVDVVMSTYPIITLTGLIDILSLPLLSPRTFQFCAQAILSSVIHTWERWHRLYASQDNIVSLLRLAKTSKVVRERLKAAEELRFEILSGSSVVDEEVREVIASATLSGVKISCIYTAPQIGILLASSSYSSPMVLKAMDGFSRKFVPRQSGSTKVYELVVPGDAIDSTSRRADHDWETGDVFDPIDGDGVNGFKYLGSLGDSPMTSS